MNNYLITGGAGFIGSTITEKLLGRGDKVVCVDNFDPYYDPELKKKNIGPFLSNPNFKLEIADILDDENNANGHKWLTAIMEQVIAYLVEVNE